MGQQPVRTEGTDFWWRYYLRYIRGVYALAYVLILLGSAQSQAQAQSVTIGETAVLSSGDNENGNQLQAQSATLAQAATIQSLSFYVTAASAFMTPPAPMAGPARSQQIWLLAVIEGDATMNRPAGGS